MSESMRPYGWGCNWSSGWCARFGQDKNYDECMKCIRVIGSPDEKKWLEFFKHANRIKNDSSEENITK